MALLRMLCARLRSLRRWSSRERDLDDEVQSYVETVTAEYERRGFPCEAARRAALVDVGGVEQVKESVRSIRVGHAVETTMRDVLYGARVLRRSPGYTLVVVLTIALGIGINVTMFSVMYAVLWRALPYPSADRIVAIEFTGQGLSSVYAAPGAPLDLRQQSHLVTNLATVVGVNANLTANDIMERVTAARASDEVLPLLGAVPLELGRALIDARDETGSRANAVVISHELWQRRFQGDPLVVGRHLEVNNIDVQVVGVTRPGFRVYLPPADHVAERVDVWFPAAFELTGAYRGDALIGRLAPGVRLSQAQASFDARVSSFVAAHPTAAPDRQLRLSIRRLADDVTREARPALLALGLAVSLVLLIACVNVANLMLARAKARERELAVRRALGASRLRLVRQLLSENLVFTLLGGAGGLLLARGGVAIALWLRPVHLPRQSEITIDGAVLLWTGGLAIASTVIFGLVPALFLTGDAIGGPLAAGRSGTMQRRRALQRGLVIAEVALSIMSLVLAGLMLRTFVNLTWAPIGFDPANVVTAQMSINLRRFPQADARWALHREAINRLREIPGVEAASAGGPLPFMPIQVTRRYWRDGDTDGRRRSVGTQQTIMPGYLNVMSIPLRAGRDLTDDDITFQRPVVIVDGRLAAQLWHGDAVGKRLALELGRKSEILEVVGVTAPIRTSRVRDESSPTIFVPYHVYEIEETLVVKTRAPLRAIGPVIKRTVESLGTGRPVYDTRTMTGIVSDSFGETRFTMLVLAGFAGAALLLAAVGLYGTLAYLISQRTQEFGVRIALGASASSMVGLVAREGGILTCLGSGIGLAGALGLARALRGLLYGVTPLDGVTFASVIALVAVVSISAVSRPAWRASRIDPTIALRHE